MTWILDGILLLLVICCFFTYSKRGFIGAVVGIIAVVAALLLAFWASGVLAPPLYNALIRERLIESVTEQLRAPAESGGIPPVLVELGALLGLGADAAAGLAGQPAQTLVDAALAEPVLNLTRTVLFLILYAIAAGILQSLARGLRRANDLPLLGLANRLGGGVLGIAVGIFYGFLFVSACALVITLTHDSLGWLNTQIVAKTRVFSLAYPYNLFALLGR